MPELSSFSIDVRKFGAVATYQTDPPSGTRVVELGSRSGSWWEVHVLDEIDGDRDLEGWVNSRYLSRAG